MPPIVTDILNALATPVIIPLVTSAVVWVLNTYTTAVAKLPDVVKQALVVVVGIGLGWAGQHFGLDITSAEGFAGSLVALGIFQLGKAKR